MQLGLTPRVTKIIAGVLAAVACVLIGFVVGSVTARPDYPDEHSADAGFARDMAAHHAQAVELGMIAYEKATRSDIRTLGGDMALTQQAQIGMMNAWLQNWGLGPNSDDPPMAWMPDGERAVNGNLMPGMATREEIQKLQDAEGEQVDILFLQYMLRHHLGGIHMAEAVIDSGPRPEVRDLADTMIKGQSSEIAVMEKHLADLGAEPLR